MSYHLCSNHKSSVALWALLGSLFALICPRLARSSASSDLLTSVCSNSVKSSSSFVTLMTQPEDGKCVPLPLELLLSVLTRIRSLESQLLVRRCAERSADKPVTISALLLRLCVLLCWLRGLPSPLLILPSARPSISSGLPSNTSLSSSIVSRQCCSPAQ